MLYNTYVVAYRIREKVTTTLEQLTGEVTRSGPS